MVSLLLNEKRLQTWFYETLLFFNQPKKILKKKRRMMALSNSDEQTKKIVTHLLTLKSLSITFLQVI
jgi:hypothetical protein